MNNNFKKLFFIFSLFFLFSAASTIYSKEWKPSQQAKERKTEVYKAAHKEINLNIAGIIPDLYKSIVPGDEIYEDLKKGYNNMHIRVKNEGDQFWRISKGVIYTSQKDLKTGIYIMNLKKPIRENEWLVFSKPVVIRILIKTKFDNYFVVEEVRSPDMLENPFWFNCYSSSEEKEIKPPNTKPVSASILQTTELKPVSDNGTQGSSAPKVEKVETENLQSSNQPSIHELMGKTGQSSEIIISSITQDVKEKLISSADEILQKKGIVKVMFRIKNKNSNRYMMNKGFKGSIKETLNGFELDVKGIVYESNNINFKEEIEALFSIQTKNKKFILGTYRGLISDLKNFITLNNYSDKEIYE